ncbi:pectate lyase family protein [Cellvibrio sp. QJXJ]|uniref:pectate lyase family protein n=1 Tax=Cellvibrio sp. QJXJ TaxID=2964606 RepID=UPI0021C3413F|nr:hypothetical protein [Cellvibrio sp. QJXJ]UUA71570.1 hypothetical protein NNX04_14245 [Cellvibrio sp. QJXJ]
MKHSNLVLSLAAAVALTACGGGGGGSSGGNSSAAQLSSSPPAASSTPSSVVSSTSLAVESSSSLVASTASSSSVVTESSSSLLSSSSVSSAALSSSSTSSVAFDFTSCNNFNTAQGFAAAGNGVTGGADTGLGNNTVTVTNGVQLNSVLSATNATYKDLPLIVYIDGPITWANSNNTEIRVRRSNVSIIGLENSGEFDGVGMRISHGASNIIVRNLLMHEVPQANGAGDHIHLDGQDGAVSNIWIDHNEFYNDLTVDKDLYDELVSGRSDVKNVTISYNLLRNSQKTSLWGSSDDAVAEDVGRTISFHHNHWKDVVSRLPLFRFGEGHIWNNYYQNVTGTGINSRMGAKIRIDNNVFENVKNPILSVDSSSIGYWNATGNSFTSVTWSDTPVASCSTAPCYAGTNDSVTTDYQPPYTYNVMATADVKNHVQTYAGRNKINSCLNLPEASSSSSSAQSSSAPSGIAINWKPSHTELASAVVSQPGANENTNFNATASTPIKIGDFNFQSSGAGNLRLHLNGAGTDYAINYNGSSLRTEPTTLVEGTSGQVNPTLLSGATGVSRYVSYAFAPSSNPITMTVTYSNASATAAGACQNGQIAIVDQTGKTWKVASSCSNPEQSTVSVTIADATVSELFILMSRNGDSGGGIRIWNIEVTQ